MLVRMSSETSVGRNWGFLVIQVVFVVVLQVEKVCDPCDKTWM